jgi:hypothetical protein
VRISYLKAASYPVKRWLMSTGCGDPDHDYGMLPMSLEADKSCQYKQRFSVEKDIIGGTRQRLIPRTRQTSSPDGGRAAKTDQVETDCFRTNCDLIACNIDNVNDILAASVMMKTALRILSDSGCGLSAAMLADAVYYLDVTIMQQYCIENK